MLLRILARSGFALFFVGGLAMLLIATNVVQLGPCTSTAGALSMLTMILTLPAGSVLLLTATVVFAFRRIQHPPKPTFLDLKLP
jgi:hypothetical protein